MRKHLGLRLWLLLVAALFMRALVPQGTMAERDDRGSIAITLCNSDGVWLIPMRDGAPQDDDRQQRDQSPCNFASLALGTPPPEPNELAVLAPAAPIFAALASFDQALRPQRLHPPARGPPVPA